MWTRACNCKWRKSEWVREKRSKWNNNNNGAASTFKCGHSVEMILTHTSASCSCMNATAFVTLKRIEKYAQINRYRAPIHPHCMCVYMCLHTHACMHCTGKNNINTTTTITINGSSCSSSSEKRERKRSTLNKWTDPQSFSTFVHRHMFVEMVDIFFSLKYVSVSYLRFTLICVVITVVHFFGWLSSSLHLFIPLLLLQMHCMRTLRSLSA